MFFSLEMKETLHFQDGKNKRLGGIGKINSCFFLKRMSFRVLDGFLLKGFADRFSKLDAKAAKRLKSKHCVLLRVCAFAVKKMPATS